MMGSAAIGSGFVAARGKLGNAIFQNWTFGVERSISRKLQVTANLMRKRGANGLTYFSNGGNTHELGNFKKDLYDSAEIAVRHSLDTRHEWTASYSRSRTLSNAVAEINVDQTRMVRNNYGRMGLDVPNRFMSWGYPTTPLKNCSVTY